MKKLRGIRHKQKTTKLTMVPIKTDKLSLDGYEKSEYDCPRTREISSNPDDEKKDKWNNYFEGSGYKLMKESESRFWKTFAIFGMIIFLLNIGVFAYLINNGKMKSIINQDVTLKPEFNATVNNDYIFEPRTTNSYSHNINNYQNITINIPEDLCGNGS